MISGRLRGRNSRDISSGLSLQKISVGLDHGFVVRSLRCVLQILLLLGLGRSSNWLQHGGRIDWGWVDHTWTTLLFDAIAKNR